MIREMSYKGTFDQWMSLLGSQVPFPSSAFFLPSQLDIWPKKLLMGYIETEKRKKSICINDFERVSCWGNW